MREMSDRPPELARMPSWADAAPQNKPAAIVRPAKPSRAVHKLPEDNPTPAIVTTTGRKQAAAEAPHLPMELPLSRKPVERTDGDYKRMKAAITRRLRGEDE
jgi:hypothetical protein